MNKEQIIKKASEKTELSKDDLSLIRSVTDVTSLNDTDTETSIRNFCEKITSFSHEQYGLKPVPAVCVYPQFIGTAKKALINTGVKVAAVAGSFPTGQTFFKVRLNEIEEAVNAGADEIDTVINRGAAIERDLNRIADEIKRSKEICGNIKLKVILETGQFNDLTLLQEVCDAALESGADFLKTSTGKVSEGATLEKGYVLAERIKVFYEKTGEKRGIKYSGGIRTGEQAMQYCRLTREVLGSYRITPELFRIGAGSLMNNLHNEIAEIKNHPWE